jgi:hypothetical protein
MSDKTKIVLQSGAYPARRPARVVMLKPDPVRNTYHLTPEESASFAKLCARTRWHNAEDIWRFWGGVAVARGLDPKSVMCKGTDRESFTALPLGYGKDWCFPSSLKVAAPPAFVVEKAAFA